MDALDQVRASNAKINKAGRELNPDEILKLVNREQDNEVETDEERLAREDAEAAKRAFEGANGEIVRRIAEGSPTAVRMEQEINPISHRPNPAPAHVFDKPVIRKRKESAVNALGIVKKKTKLI